MDIPPHVVFSHKQQAKFHPYEDVRHLYVSVVKARHLLEKDVTGGYVEVRLGKYKETTRHVKMNNPEDPEWNQVFAFLMTEKIEATMLEITVKNTDVRKDDFMGWVLYDLSKTLKKMAQPDAPQWHVLEDRKCNSFKGELMFSVWWGTQADDEALLFPQAISGQLLDAPASVRSKVYLSPKLWYLRVNVIEAQDLMIRNDRTRVPEVFVKAVLGHQALKTRSVSISKSTNPMWNEDLMFVTAEPFEEPLVLSVEDRVAPDKDELLGRCVISLQYVGRRLDHNKVIKSRWFNLETYVGRKTKQAKFVSRIRMSICLEGGYHVVDESTHYGSDFRPAAKQLWKKSIGILELGILSADGFLPMKTKDGRVRTDAYCVAKYGPKWVRTRTIIDNCSPKWNEQYTWEVFDPCTVISIGVFNNYTRIGKVRIRVSTLEPGRMYIHSYPLLVLHPSGVKKMGEINLAVRFTCSSLLNMMRKYSQPLLSEMHYICPLTVTQLDSLRDQATQIISRRLSRAEPPLTKEIVEYMLDVGCDMWSLRRSKANFLRIKRIFDNLFAVGKWFVKNPINTISIPIIFSILAMYPELILSSIFISLFVIGVCNHRHRPRYPPHMDARLSCADDAHPDELEGEFNTVPSSHPPDVISVRYDHLVGDIATQGERLQSLLSWRDPTATLLFVMFCPIAAIVLYATPFYVVVMQTLIYVLYHKNKIPLAPINFFRRLPARTDSML